MHLRCLYSFRFIELIIFARVNKQPWISHFQWKLIKDNLIPRILFISRQIEGKFLLVSTIWFVLNICLQLLEQFLRPTIELAFLGRVHLYRLIALGRHLDIKFTSHLKLLNLDKSHLVNQLIESSIFITTAKCHLLSGL